MSGWLWVDVKKTESFMHSLQFIGHFKSSDYLCARGLDNSKVSSLN